MPLNLLSAFTGQGGFTPTAATGPLKGGDIAGSTFNNGGINTGTQSSIPPWVWGVGAAVAVVAIVAYLAKKR